MVRQDDDDDDDDDDAFVKDVNLTIFCVAQQDHKATHRVMAIIRGNEHGDLSSNPGQGSLHFT